MASYLGSPWSLGQQYVLMDQDFPYSTPTIDPFVYTQMSMDYFGSIAPQYYFDMALDYVSTQYQRHIQTEQAIGYYFMGHDGRLIYERGGIFIDHNRHVVVDVILIDDPDEGVLEPEEEEEIIGIKEFLTRRRIKRPDFEGEQDNVCAICLNGLWESSDDNDDSVARLYCQHEYHFDCIERWLQRKNECPLCRATVVRGLR